MIAAELFSFVQTAEYCQMLLYSIHSVSHMSEICINHQYAVIAYFHFLSLFLLIEFLCHCISSVASIPIPGGRSFHPVKNRGSLDKVADQNSPPLSLIHI